MNHRIDTSGTRRLRRRIGIGLLCLITLAIVVLGLRQAGVIGEDSPDPVRAAPSSGQPDDEPSATGTGSAGPRATATPGSTSSAGSSDSNGDGFLTPLDLEPLILRGSDLPPGWRTLDDAEAALDTLIGQCLREALDARRPEVSLSATFRFGSGGSALSSAVLGYPEPAKATAAFAAITAAAGRCASSSANPSVRGTSFTSRADQARAFELTFRKGSDAALGTLVVARVNTRLTTLVLIGIEQGDVKIGQDAVRTVIARLG